MQKRKQMSLREAREQGRLAEFIEQHAEELVEDEEFTALLERINLAVLPDELRAELRRLCDIDRANARMVEMTFLRAILEHDTKLREQS